MEENLPGGLRTGFVIKRPLSILTVSTADILGGAEKVARDLFQGYRARGYNSWLAVGHRHSDHPNILLIPNQELKGGWTRFWEGVESYFRSLEGWMRGAWRIKHLARILADPWKFLDIYRGIEDFRFPGIGHLLKMVGQPLDIIHCHNLHGGYFDLRILPRLSQQIPVVLTLHDAWLLSGHCSHSFDCERWKTGCGNCPDLTISPAIRRDATAYNWQRKQKIYTKSRLYVATPSRWLMERVEQSMLAPVVAEARIIPNGVDLSVFHPADKQEVRAALGIRQDSKMLLCVANRIRTNIWKDYQTIRAAIVQVAERLQDKKILFIALGDVGPAERIGQAEIHFVPFQSELQTVARYYQAADVYLHAARVETFPLTLLEAMACGTPVVATAVGGILEQVKGAKILKQKSSVLGVDAHGLDEATGILVQPGQADEMAKAIESLLTDENLRQRLSEQAVKDTRQRFDLCQQIDAYIKWYQTILDCRKRRSFNHQQTLEYK